VDSVLSRCCKRLATIRRYEALPRCLSHLGAAQQAPQPSLGLGEDSGHFGATLKGRLRGDPGPKVLLAPSESVQRPEQVSDRPLAT